MRLIWTLTQSPTGLSVLLYRRSVLRSHCLRLSFYWPSRAFAMWSYLSHFFSNTTWRLLATITLGRHGAGLCLTVAGTTSVIHPSSSSTSTRRSWSTTRSTSSVLALQWNCSPGGASTSCASFAIETDAHPTWLPSYVHLLDELPNTAALTGIKSETTSTVVRSQGAEKTQFRLVLSAMVPLWIFQKSQRSCYEKSQDWTKIPKLLKI